MILVFLIIASAGIAVFTVTFKDWVSIEVTLILSPTIVLFGELGLYAKFIFYAHFEK